MSTGPTDPAEYGHGAVWTEARLKLEDYATGLDVWGQVTKAYENYLGDGEMANAQLWSLRQAIRAQVIAEMGGTDPDDLPEHLA